MATAGATPTAITTVRVSLDQQPFDDANFVRHGRVHGDPRWPHDPRPLRMGPNRRLCEPPPRTNLSTRRGPRTRVTSDGKCKIAPQFTAS